MRVVLKKDRPLTLHPGDNSAIASRIRRKVRAHCREVGKAFGNDGEHTCSICIEPLEDMLDIESTACGHVFHKECFHNFRKAKVMTAMEQFRCEDDGLINGREMAELMVAYDTGFTCPNCRCKNPLIHQLAKRTVKRARPYELGGVRLELSTADVLAMVTHS